MIRNNVSGYEKDVLERYSEPTWNNPVVRFVGSDGKDVIPRKDRVWSTAQLLPRMKAALEGHGSSVPHWLSTVAEEAGSGDVEAAVFAMT